MRMALRARRPRSPPTPRSTLRSVLLLLIMNMQNAEQHACPPPARAAACVRCGMLQVLYGKQGPRLSHLVCSKSIRAHGRHPPPSPRQLLALEREAPRASTLQHHEDIANDWQVELISWKSIKDIAGDGGVIKTVETEGQGWEKPSDKDEALGTHAQAGC